MSSNLYLLFETEGKAEATLPQFLQQMIVPGYSFSDSPLKHVIKAPGEPDAAERCLFYAQNYFRIYISDLAIQFYREIPLPSALATGERHLQSALFNLCQFKLRRWVCTEEGWDDDDNLYINIVSEGNSRESFDAGQGESSP